MPGSFASGRLGWAGALLLMGLSARAGADSFDVTTTADELNGAVNGVSLREAITTADNNGVADVINLPAGTYTLTIGDLPVINSEMTIMGGGAEASATTLDGASAFRPFFVTSIGNLTLVNLRVRNGRAAGGDGGSGAGGGGGAAGLGGGVCVNGGSLTVTDCVFLNCLAAGGAGGAGGAATNGGGGGGTAGDGVNAPTSTGGSGGFFGGFGGNGGTSPGGNGGPGAGGGGSAPSGINGSAGGTGGFGGGAGGGCASDAGGGAGGNGGHGGGGGGAGSNISGRDEFGGSGGMFAGNGGNCGPDGGDNGGGGGGAGLGGAICLLGGSLTLTSATFDGNAAVYGSGGSGNGGTPGSDGLGKGGALFVNAGTVNDGGGNIWVNNTATDDLGISGDDDHVYGSTVPVELSVVEID